MLRTSVLDPQKSRDAKAAMEVIRSSHVHAGASLVECPDSKFGLVEISPRWLKELVDASEPERFPAEAVSMLKSETGGNFLPLWLLLFAPPIPRVLRFLEVPAQGLSRQYLETRFGFWRYLEANLRPQDRFVHEEYGIFWSKEAVEGALRERFADKS